MPALEALPEKLKPMTEKAPAMSGFWAMMASARSASAVGVSQRRARRRLHDDHQVALVLLRNEAGGHMLVDPDRCAQAGKEEHQQHIAQLAAPRESPWRRCDAQPADLRVGGVNEGGKEARDRRDVQEVELLGAVFFAAQEHGRESRRKRERVEGRDGDGKGDGQRELAIENAGGAGKERDRHEDGDQNQRGGDDGAGDLAHGARCGRVGIGVLHVRCGAARFR